MDTGTTYQEINASFFDRWNAADWEWGLPVDHACLDRAKKGDWSVLLTPVKPVPKNWFPPMDGAEILGLACGGQQMPVFTALGAACTVMDYSRAQLECERRAAARVGCSIRTVRADMTKSFPFPDESFDLIFHPVSNCYIEDVESVWRECFRVLRHGGILLSGMAGGLIYAFNADETALKYRLPFNPLQDPALYAESMKNDWGVQFSHTLEEQIGGQLRAGFVLKDLYEDTGGAGRLHDFNVPAFLATKSVRE